MVEFFHKYKCRISRQKTKRNKTKPKYINEFLKNTLKNVTLKSLSGVLNITVILEEIESATNTEQSFLGFTSC